MTQSSLTALKDDMVAFISGHGLRRIPAYINDDVPIVVWDDDENADSWKDLVEAAAAAKAPFVILSESRLEKEDLEVLINELRESGDDSSDLDEAEALTPYVGKLGCIRLAFAHQGVIFLHETTAPWYEHYTDMLESVAFLDPTDPHDRFDEDEN